MLANSPSNTASSPPADIASLSRINNLYAITQDLLVSFDETINDICNAVPQSKYDQLLSVSKAADECMRLVLGFKIKVIGFRMNVLDEVYRKAQSEEAALEEWRDMEAVVKGLKGEAGELKGKVVEMLAVGCI